MADALWKAEERQVAEKIGGKCFPIQDQAHADVESDYLALEVVMRKKAPGGERGRLERARRIAGPKRLGGVVRTQPGTSEAIIAFDLDDFCSWHVGGPIKVEVKA
jgi:hypothetical protein